jgi:HlyD family secretion protein
MKRKKLLVIIIIAVLIAGVLSYALLRNKNNSTLSYAIKPVEIGDIQNLVVATGTVNPVTTVEVGSQVSGRIEKLYVDYNSRVKAGQIIAQLEQSLFTTKVKQSEANYKSAAASLEKTKVNLDNAKKALERTKNLFTKGFASPQEKDAAEEIYLSCQAEVKAAEARLEQAAAQLDSNKVDLEHTIITSPIDGIVISRNVNVGQTVAASFQAPVLFEIANDLAKMQIDCNVDEADIGSIKEGQQATFTVDAFPEEVFQGKVIQVRFNPIIVQNVVTYNTIIEVDNVGLKLKPGMTATVSIVVDERRDVLKVPNTALRFTANLSLEEKSKLFENLSSEVGNKRKEMKQSLENSKGGNFPTDIKGSMFLFKSSMSNMLQGKLSLIWILNDKKEAIPLRIITGLSDENYTEIVDGDLIEGQMVITGLDSGSEKTTKAEPRFGPPPF